MNIADLASLPTDNLYKFVAISGLVVVLASVGLAAHHRRELQRRFFQVKRIVTVHGAKVNAANASVNMAQKLTADLKQTIQASLDSISQSQAASTKDVSVPNFDAVLMSLQTTLNTTSETVAKNSIESAELGADIGELEFLAAQLKTLRTTAIAGVGIGSALMASGFFLWYTKVHVFLDQALAIQAAAPK